MLILGGNQAYRKSAEILEVSRSSTSVCTQPIEIPDKHSKGAVGAYINKNAILCGGWFAKKQCHEFKFTENLWSKAPFSLLSERSEAAGTTLPNGSWIIIGGKTSENEPLFTSEMLESDIFMPTLVWPEPVSGHCVEKINSTHIFIAGGEGSKQVLLDSAYIMDAYSSFWMSLESGLNNKRRGHVCGTLESNGEEFVVVAGGRILEVELLNMKSMRFERGPKLPFEMDWAASFQIGKTFVIVGGEHIGYCSKSYLCYSSDALFEIDIENDAWKAFNQTLRLPRSKHIVLPIPKDDVVQDLCQDACPSCQSKLVE